MEWGLILKVGIPVVIISFLGFFKVFEKCIRRLSNPKLEDSNTSLVASTDIIQEISTPKYPDVKLKEHNEILINVLLAYMSDHQNRLNEIEGRMNQASVIYFTVLAAILAYLSNKSSENNTIVESSTLIIILIVIILMYLINVHFEDVKRKFSYKRYKEQEAIKKLSNLKLSDTSWYVLNFDNQKALLEKASRCWFRWIRKILRALSPSFVQIIYYIIPFGFILYLILAKPF